MSPLEPTIQQLFDMTGHTALITGGSGWLGSSMARALAEAGCQVVVASRDQEKASKSAALLPAVAGERHHGVALDHMQADSLHRGFHDAVAAAGKVDVLVNNGLEFCGRDLTHTSFDEFARQQVNNAGYFELSRLTRDHAVAHGTSASIILIGSMYGSVGSYPEAYEGVCEASPVAYHALKGGTIHMTRHLAVYWAQDKVRVNCLSPGPFPQTSAPSEMVARLERKTPLARMGRPHELKGALLLLASEAGSYITGQNILVDGGWTAW